MVPANLDLDVLRTLAVAMELGSFARAAERLGRTQSAVSLQMRRLEAQVGQPVLRKQGRGLALTDAGDVLLGYARRMLELNDAALSALKGSALAGTVRVGVHQDFAEAALPAVLARFARAHPAVGIAAQVERNAVLLDRLAHGQLDLALVFGASVAPAPGVTATPVGELPMAWLAARDYARDPDAPLPLIVFEAPCVFRDPALAALERARVAWRIALTSPSLAGLWAAAEAGLGVTVRTRLGLPRALAPLDTGLPTLPRVGLTLHAAADPAPAAARLRDILLEVLADGLGVGE
jgi:DNA-binding transcriptional LysR family regulator